MNVEKITITLTETRNLAANVIKKSRYFLKLVLCAVQYCDIEVRQMGAMEGLHRVNPKFKFY